MTPESLARFLAKVGKPTTGCTEWLGQRRDDGFGTKLGYGRVRIDRVEYLTHRVAWAIANPGKPLPPVVRHTCDNPICVAPNHLVGGTQADNVQDTHARGRARKRGVRGEQRTTTGLTDTIVLDIRSRVASGQKPVQVGRLYGQSSKNVWVIIHRRTWTHI